MVVVAAGCGSQQSDCVAEMSRSFLTLRARRSSSRAASVRMLSLSLADTGSPVPFSTLTRGDSEETGEEDALSGLLPVPATPPAAAAAAADPGETDFLCSRELKKFASTPSPLWVPGVSLPST